MNARFAGSSRRSHGGGPARKRSTRTARARIGASNACTGASWISVRVVNSHAGGSAIPRNAGRRARTLASRAPAMLASFARRAARSTFATRCSRRVADGCRGAARRARRLSARRRIRSLAPCGRLTSDSRCASSLRMTGVVRTSSPRMRRARRSACTSASARRRKRRRGPRGILRDPRRIRVRERHGVQNARAAYQREHGEVAPARNEAPGVLEQRRAREIVSPALAHGRQRREAGSCRRTSRSPRALARTARDPARTARTQREQCRCCGPTRRSAA